MAEKDILEKTLEAYDNVFADIVNVLLFDGEKIIREEELEKETPRSIYKADGKIHEQERDVAKFWRKENIRIALYGLENQTKIDSDMPLRIISYDGAAYRSQLLDKKQKELFPVITLVLYFDYTKRWDKAKSLKECFDVPEKLKPYVNDYKINLFEIAWLDEKKVAMFQSDFKYIADYCVQMRTKGYYTPQKDDAMEHAKETFELLSVLTGDSRFRDVANEMIMEGGTQTMCEFLDRIEAEGKAKGREEGREEGREQGREEERMKNARSMIKIMQRAKQSNAEIKEALKEFECTPKEIESLVKEFKLDVSTKKRKRQELEL